jgi:hypothetical protein
MIPSLVLIGLVLPPCLSFPPSLSADDTSRDCISKRNAINQPWTTKPQYDKGLGVTSVGSGPIGVQFDGADLWVASSTDQNGALCRVRASDGKLLETWTQVYGGYAVLVAMGRVFVTGGFTNPGYLYMIDPSQPAGTGTVVSMQLGSQPEGIAFDGERIWTSNIGGSISIITPQINRPWPVTTIGGFNALGAITYKSPNIWVTDAGSLLKLNAQGSVIQRIFIGDAISGIAFDGARFWLPMFNHNSLAIVDASTGQILRKLTGNGLNQPFSITYDSERILVTNHGADTISLWKACDFSPIGTFSTGAGSMPQLVCSDGLNFWITLGGTNKLARF